MLFFKHNTECPGHAGHGWHLMAIRDGRRGSPLLRRPTLSLTRMSGLVKGRRVELPLEDSCIRTATHLPPRRGVRVFRHINIQKNKSCLETTQYFGSANGIFGGIPSAAWYRFLADPYGLFSIWKFVAANAVSRANALFWSWPSLVRSSHAVSGF